MRRAPDDPAGPPMIGARAWHQFRLAERELREQADPRGRNSHHVATMSASLRLRVFVAQVRERTGTATASPGAGLLSILRIWLTGTSPETGRSRWQHVDRWQSKYRGADACDPSPERGGLITVWIAAQKSASAEIDLGRHHRSSTRRPGCPKTIWHIQTKTPTVRTRSGPPEQQRQVSPLAARCSSQYRRRGRSSRSHLNMGNRRYSCPSRTPGSTT